MSKTMNDDNRRNYYSPLQTLDSIDLDSFSELHQSATIAKKVSKVYVPPITLLKCNFEQVHKLCKVNAITDYSVQKNSIGLKVFCKTKVDRDLLCRQLNANKSEFFTYATKDEKPYKALLFGLDKVEPTLLKCRLNKLSLKCIDVKLVQKTGFNKVVHIIYVVYFERQSITMKELKNNYSVIDYVKVRWDFKRKNSSNITQCYNCQMFGHGAKHCKVKTFCAKCADNHATSECKANSTKCANCGGPHEASSKECPNRLNYLDIKQRSRRNRPNIPSARKYVVTNYNQTFPDALGQNATASNLSWPNANTRCNFPNNNSELFTPDEVMNITLELISKLKDCKCKADQFVVITNLACKFLS